MTSRFGLRTRWMTIAHSSGCQPDLVPLWTNEGSVAGDVEAEVVRLDLGFLLAVACDSRRSTARIRATSSAMPNGLVM